ncbi:hypothetical protein CBFG_03265 [Clostridiales bacterium 1_7_47FAA]|nr:hypothetical protein CBFG_03265 [Clostridiales bacterium 1_7_47FAA]
MCEDIVAFSQGIDGYEVVLSEFQGQLLLRFEKSGKLVLQIDCSCSLEDFADYYVEEAIAHLVWYAMRRIIRRPIIWNMPRHIGMP